MLAGNNRPESLRPAMEQIPDKPSDAICNRSDWLRSFKRFRVAALIGMMLLCAINPSLMVLAKPSTPLKSASTRVQKNSANVQKKAPSPVVGKATLATPAKAAPRASKGEYALGTPEFLWRVSNEIGTVYLIGTLHMVKGDFFPLPREMEKAFEHSQYLVLEIDLTKTDPARLQKLLTEKGKYEVGSGDTLTKHISEETQKALAAYLSKLGLSITIFDGQKPWLVALLVAKMELQKLGFQPELGIDQHFLQLARAREKKVIGLETEDFQLGLLAGFEDDLQDEMLRLNLLEVKDLKTIADEMMQKWRAGDVSGMDGILTKDVKKYPELLPVQEKMLYERNVDMEAKIEKMVQSGDTYFIAVGSGHMVGDRGIIALLTKNGFKVEQIKAGMSLPIPSKHTAAIKPESKPSGSEEAPAPERGKEPTLVSP